MSEVRNCGDSSATSPDLFGIRTGIYPEGCNFRAQRQ